MGPLDAAALAQLVSHPAVLLEPDRLVWPPSWIEHIPFAFWLMDVLRPRVFVELGTHSGNSYAAFAQAVQQLGLTSAGYAVDTWKGDPHAGFYDESVFTEWRDYHDRRYSSFSRLVRSTFDEAVGYFANGSVDLLNIDGYHTTEAVNHDFHTWLPKMSARGVVLLHDINVRERGFGAWEVWERLRATHPSFSFLHGHGLGVLAVGAEVPAQLAWLAGLDATQPSSIARVREVFARAGGTILAHYRAAAAEAALAEAHVSLSLRDASVAELHAKRSGLETTLADAHLHASELTGRVAELTEQLRARDAQIADLGVSVDSAAAETRAQLRARDAQIAVLGVLLGRATDEEKRRAEELAARAKANVDALTRLSELSNELLHHARARAFQESLSLASAQSLAAATAQMRALTARVRSLSSVPSGAPRAASTRITRAVATLRSLGASPRAVLRQPSSIRTLLRLALNPRAIRDAHLIAHSGIFDAARYRERSPDVAAKGLSPLAHFVLSGGVEGRSPHPLFDSAWYLARYQDVAVSGINPLAHYLRTAAHEAREPHALFSTPHYRAQVPAATALGGTPLQHYVRHGALEGRSPHPLFDPEYYVVTYGDVLDALDPFVHFLETGAAANFDPHPLFDTEYYRAQVPELKESALNPLLHYLQSAPSRTRRPHPLFDPAFYLRAYVDVAAAGVEPLTHFVVTGGAEGRRPIPEFDSAWYLSTYSDVGRSGANPLVHFVRHGWHERRNPSPNFDTAAYLGRYADVARSTTNPLVHYLEHGRAEGRIVAPEAPELRAVRGHDAQLRLHASNLDGARRTERAIVCLTHVMPVPPRAGNEYRIHRMLRWMRDAGYVVIPIVAPTDGTRPTRAELRALADEYGNAVVCPPDGRVEYVLRDVPDVLQSLNGETPRDWAAVLGEHLRTSKRERELLQIERTYCTDALLATVLRLQSVLGPFVLLAEYIWMSRALPLIGSQALKIIDTHDVFSTREEKVGQFGIQELTISRDAERRCLERADLVVAIQDNERAELEALAPGLQVVTAGVDFDLVADPGTPLGPRILYVASGNAINRRALTDFLKFAWPRVRARVPDAELMVVGPVGETLALVPAGVTVAGRVGDLSRVYRECRVVVNPAVAGTGLKIKTIEALAHLRPIVTWPNGVDGLSPALAALCRTADDWYSFSDLVVELLTDDRPSWFSASDRDLLRNEGAPNHVYADVGRAIHAFFAAHAGASGDARRDSHSSPLDVD